MSSTRRMAMPLAAILTASAFLAAPPAGAYTEDAVVAKVADGDSLYVKGARAPIRLIGVDTPEQETCGYDAAKKALTQIAGPKTRVRLSARDENSFAYGNGFRRPLRYVDNVKTKRDASLTLLEKGLGVFNNTVGEYDRELEYVQAAQRAAAARVGLFSPNRCGVGPAATLQIFAHYNAHLNDKQNMAGKWVRVVNRGAKTVDLNGWRLRPSNRKYYTFRNVVLAPQQSAVVHNGPGRSYMKDGDFHFYWGTKIDIPDPATSTFEAGSMFLQDPVQNFRAWTFWPCVIDCPTQQLVGKLQLFANWNNRDEYVEVINPTSEPVDASFLVLQTGPSVFEIPQGNLLAPGQSLRVWARPHGSDYTFDRGGQLFSRSGGEITLRGNDGVVVTDLRWIGPCSAQC